MNVDPSVIRTWPVLLAWWISHVSFAADHAMPSPSLKCCYGIAHADDNGMYPAAMEIMRIASRPGSIRLIVLLHHLTRTNSMQHLKRDAMKTDRASRARSVWVGRKAFRICAP